MFSISKVPPRRPPLCWLNSVIGRGVKERLFPSRERRNGRGMWGGRNRGSNRPNAPHPTFPFSPGGRRSPFPSLPKQGGQGPEAAQDLVSVSTLSDSVFVKSQKFRQTGPGS